MNILPITVIIPTMNRPQTLLETIHSYMSGATIPNQIIIVDQSINIKEVTENENILLNTYPFIKFNYIHLATPSLTKARNIGMELAINEIVICSDDDIEVFQDTLFNIYETMKDSKIAMIGGLDTIDIKRESILGYVFFRKNIFKSKEGHLTKAMFGRYPQNVDNITTTMWTMGYFFVIRKSLINKWNLKWDENLIGYAYPEDLDFSFSYYKKAIIENLQCILKENIKVKHLVSSEWRTTSYKSTLMYVINREYLSYKHFSSPISRVMTRWSNFGEFFRRLFSRDNALDIIKAQYYCDKYRKDIKNGIIPVHLYK